MTTQYIVSIDCLRCDGGRALWAAPDDFLPHPLHASKAGHEVHFPHRPYPVQLQYMQKMITGGLVHASEQPHGPGSEGWGTCGGILHAQVWHAWTFP